MSSYSTTRVLYLRDIASVEQSRNCRCDLFQVYMFIRLAILFAAMNNSSSLTKLFSKLYISPIQINCHVHVNGYLVYASHPSWDFIIHDIFSAIFTEFSAIFTECSGIWFRDPILNRFLQYLVLSFQYLVFLIIWSKNYRIRS